MTNTIKLSDLSSSTDQHPWVSVFSICAEMGVLNGPLAVRGLEDVTLTFYKESHKVGYIRNILTHIHPTNPNLSHMNLEVKGTYVECFTTRSHKLLNEANDFVANGEDITYMIRYCDGQRVHTTPLYQGLRFGYKLTDEGKKLHPRQQEKLMALAVFKLTQFLRYSL